MTELEQLIRRELDELPPLPGSAQPDWDDVLGRVQPRANRRRTPQRARLALATLVAVLGLVAVVATPLGAALGRTFDDFSAWVRGEPGTPASEREQAAFERANARSWASFPAGTELRRLIRTKVAGVSFTLFGFRSGDALCLRLVAVGPAGGTSTSCAPLRALRTAKEPALVVATDFAVGTSERTDRRSALQRYGYLPVRTAATFGIAADEVTRVTVEADDGDHAALIGGNAFLYVADHPALGVRVRGATAVAGGVATELPLAPAPFGMLGGMSQAPLGTPHGPKGVQRTVTHGSIGWLERREPRGEPLPAKLAPLATLELARPVFARLIQPDPGYPVKVAVMAGPALRDEAHDPSVCKFVVSNEMTSGGCSTLDDLFALVPFRTGMGITAGGDQYAWLSGIASDDVAALTLFLGNGIVQSVPIVDNVYVVPAERAFFPVRLVAYDTEGRIIGNDLIASDGMTTRVSPGARNSLRIRARLEGPHGTRAVLRVGEPSAGRLCTQLVMTTGSGWGGCGRFPSRGGPPLPVARINAGDDLFIVGTLPPEIARVTVRYPGGPTEHVRTFHGILAYVVPTGHPRRGGETIVLTGYDSSGAVLARRGLRIRP